MGFGDKLKGLKDQAQQAVAENKDRIQDAVQVAGDIANTKTNGKYANKIGKVGMKVEAGIDKFADSPEAGSETPAAAAPAHAAPGQAAPAQAAPAAPAPAAPAGEPPAFEDHQPAAAPQPGPALDASDGAPTEDSQSAPAAHEPANPVSPSAADTAGSGFPDFE